MNEVFHTGSEVTSSCPNVLNESDFRRVDLQLFSEPAIIEFDTLILEEVVLAWLVEDLNSNHYES